MSFRGIALLPILIMFGVAEHAAASGFQLIEQNASGIGNAFGGSAAVAENASTIFFNPAGMTQLRARATSAGVSAVRPSFKFTDNGSSIPTAFRRLPPCCDRLSVGSVGTAAWNYFHLLQAQYDFVREEHSVTHTGDQSDFDVDLAKKVIAKANFGLRHPKFVDTPEMVAARKRYSKKGKA